MAPVKRSAAVAQRETRSTRSTAVAKKNVVAAEKKAVSPLTEKAPKSTKSVTATRRGQKATQDDAIESDELAAEEEPVAEIKSSKTRSTKPTTRTTTSKSTTTSSTALAPRRRIKVTPLDATGETSAKELSKTIRNPAKEPVTSKKLVTSSRKAADEVESEIDDPAAEAPKPRSSRRTATSKVTTTKSKTATTAPKTKAKSKKAAVEDKAEPAVQEDLSMPVARVTRARAGSTATQQSDVVESVIQPRVTKGNAGSRKKVTFQDLPEDDKENQPLPSTKSKKSIAQPGVTKTTSKATGIRAKPVRSTTTSSTTRARKATAGTKAVSKRSTTKEQEKHMPSILTPKKVTQVAKGRVNDETDDLSDGEDELNGGKTPVRDLSMSPRRPLNPAIAKAMSPAKKLLFEQSLVPTSPNKDNGLIGGNVFGQSAILASPARRLPASPFKEGLKDSPRRGMGESTRLLFPAHSEVHDGATSFAVNMSSTNQNGNTLLQSPKRTGILDSDFFSQSAMKKSTSKSPFKSSLMASPAKRLFSPEKKIAKQIHEKISDWEMDMDDDRDQEVSPISAQEISATSHFRASMSPVRVHRMEIDVPNMNFDDSILPVGSPFKVAKTTTDIPEITALTASSIQTDDMTEYPQQNVENITFEQPSIDPSQLEKSPLPDKHNGQDQLVDADADNHESASKSPTQRSAQVLITETIPRDDTATSEDELAADETPLRTVFKRVTGTAKSNSLSRQSFGVPPSAAGKGYGFTPLAAKMSGWLANSPKKTPKTRAGGLQRVGSFEFTPVAAQHIDGEVVVSRDSTPLQKLSKRDSLFLTSHKKAQPSLDQRKSLPQSQPLDVADLPPAPDAIALTENSQFEELMEAKTLADNAGTAQDETEEENLVEENADFEHIMSLDQAQNEDDEVNVDDTVLVVEAADEGEAIRIQTENLTTDLINFTNASDTAMVDFQKLAEEAENLASADPEIQALGGQRSSISRLSTCQEAVEDINGSSDNIYGDENEMPIQFEVEDDAQSRELEAVEEQSPLPEGVSSPLLQPTIQDGASPSTLDIMNVPSDTPEPEIESSKQDLEAALAVTPVQTNLHLGKQRMVNTVVSKVPLRPEGHISPIKMSRKRARSFGNAAEPSQKRLSLSGLKQIQIPTAEENIDSPDRSMRTSVAPSPGGTSTPASRYARVSLGGQSFLTTPGQMSFAIDDFGDSTLDGIELPDDFTQVTIAHDDGNNVVTPALSEKTYGLASMMATPKLATQGTPGTLKRSARRVTAPASVTKTRINTEKTPQRNSLQSVPGRTPLKPVGKGALDGAIVFVDVHTSEGADASGIFVELLTQMGAKCVKEWRWNPRASLAATSDTQQNEAQVGITHVVYKDGGKRTLEKVRDAKGQVWCVGVAWVLDCERESKWLDESTYAVDTALVPRGGSRRRKSMEPRALLNAGNGSLSTGKPRRSVSAEMSEMMRLELINTPVRGREVQQISPDNDDDEDEENIPVATPTGFISYDPRTAMTPGTPYLADQNKKIIQMSAPPKQTGKSLFEDENDENESSEDAYNNEGARDLDSGKIVSDAKKFKMKNLDMKSRRKTLGFKPLIGSPLSRTERN